MSAKASYLRLLIEKYVRLVQLTWPTLLRHIQTGNWSGIFYIQKKILWKLGNIFPLPLTVFLVLIMRFMRPFLLVRVGILPSERIGHFSVNTELYLCERDTGINVPECRYVDIWYHNWPICNRQLAYMWNRVLCVGPRWLLSSVCWMNALIPRGECHRIGENTGFDRDVHNLLDKLSPHVSFLLEEEERGEAGLRTLGIPEGAPFVCLLVRDSSYLKETVPWKSWGYHDYRDCDVQNYILAAEKLVKRGYYVIRMGAVVKEAMNIDHPMVIDYAVNGMRIDFMDIYLSAKCVFCISNGSGLDAVSIVFRRPMVYVDNVPLEHVWTCTAQFISTTKKHWLRNEKRFMTFREIFESGAGSYCYSGRYKTSGIDLLESTPEEIAAVVLEMEERLRGVWKMNKEDEELQRRFWALLPKSELHGEIHSRIGADFLRRHIDWLD